MYWKRVLEHDMDGSIFSDVYSFSDTAKNN